jgi:CheY-like chemotaxis protein
MSSLDNKWHLEQDRKFQILQNLRLIVVDDHEDCLELVKFTFQGYGMQVVTALSAGEAFEVIKQFQPDILISDIAMPKEDGYYLIHKIRNLPSPLGDIPAIALTSLATEEHRICLLKAGFQVYLSKPVNLDELVDSVVDLARVAIIKRSAA